MDTMYPPYEAAQGHGKQKEFYMRFLEDIKRHPAQPIAKQNVPDARRVLRKDCPVCIITYQAGHLHRKTLSFSKNENL